VRCVVSCFGASPRPFPFSHRGLIPFSPIRPTYLCFLAASRARPFISIPSAHRSIAQLRARPRAAKNRAHVVLVLERRRCPLPRGQEDRRGLVRCHIRGHEPAEQPAGRHQIRTSFPIPSHACPAQRVWHPDASPVTPVRINEHTLIIFCAQEPRKSDAPQLRDEYRTYKILVGCRECSPLFTS
jgi:hypothetical protein